MLRARRLDAQDGIAGAATVETHNDPQLLPCRTPVTAYYSTAQLFSRKVLRLEAIWLLVALGLVAIVRYPGDANDLSCSG